MTNILHIASSSNLNASLTRQIGSVVLEDLKKASPAANIVERDLVKNPLPHISPEFLGAMFTGQGEALALSDQLINEVFAADTLVIEVPMYNFGIPSGLKAWIDHIARAGKTFKYGENGPEGLVKGKKAILVISRGGIYSEGPYKVMDFQEPYMRSVLGFIGIKDVEAIYIEGVALGAEKAKEAMEKATRQTHIVTQAA